MSESVAETDGDQLMVAEDEGALKPSRGRRALLFLLAFSPVIVLGFAIAANAVNIPVWDDWERGEMWYRYFGGTLDFEYMYSPHIEHRSLFPRLITLAGGLWFGGDLRLEIWVIYLMVAGTTLLCHSLLKSTIGRGAALWPATFLINLLICSPVQYPDFLWPSMVAFMMPFLCLAGILVCSVSRLHVVFKIAIFIALCEIGTHSFAEGLVLWPVAVCLPLFSPRGFGTMRSRIISAVVVAAVCVLTLVPYFTWNFKTTSHISHTYSTPTGETPSNFAKLKGILKKPKAPREYFFKSLGNPVVRLFDEHPDRSARNVGRVLFGGFVLSLAFVFWRRKDRETWVRLLPWIAAACFAVSTAVLLALGRSSSPHRATMPRYIPMTIFLLVALVAIGAYVILWWSGRARNEHAAAKRAAWGWGIGALVATLLISQWGYGLEKMRMWRDARYEARATLVFINLFEPKRIGRIDNTVGFVRKQAARMNEYGLLQPPLADRWGFGPFQRDTDELTGATAKAGISLLPGGVEVIGFAELPDGRVADGVLVTVDSEEGGIPEVLGFIEMHSALLPKNPFIDGHFGSAPDLAQLEEYAAFDGRIELPEGTQLDAAKVACWALDARGMKAYRIQ